MSLSADDCSKTAPTDFPEGWALPKLGDICEHPQYGWTTSAQHQGDGLKLLRTTDISGQLLDWSSVPFCKEEPPDPDKYLLKKGDIVVSRAGSVGVSYLLGDCPPAVFASYLIRLRACKGLMPEFLRLYLLSPEYLAALSDQAAGIAVQNINASKLRELEVPLAPLAEQQRIVAKVEELLERVNAARARLAKLPALLKRFRQSVLAAACSGRLTADWRVRSDIAQEVVEDLPTGWSWVKLADLIPPGGLFDGPFGSNLKTSDYTDAGVRVIRLENIGQLRFIEEKHCYISEAKYASLTRHTVSEHDIIFASFISDEVRACVLPRLATKAIAKADCFCLRPKDDRVDRRYLALQLVSHETHDAFIGDVHGATRPRINLTQLKQLKVRICPVEEQREIVRRVDVMFALVGRIEAQVRASTSRVNHLPQTILARAFRGELVPTEAELAAAEGRDYEPADRLLARIREATAQHDSQKKAAGATTRKRGAIKKMDKASAQQVIEAMPKGLFTFDELRAKLPGDYDALKEILFSLLDDPQSGVVQVFDKKAKSMRFQRMTKP